MDTSLPVIGKMVEMDIDSFYKLNFWYHYLYLVFYNWVIWPLVVVFCMPLILLFLVYLTGLFFIVNKLIFPIQAKEDKLFWNKCIYKASLFWEMVSHVWHGYEVVGMENLPETGPALLVFYHGAIPVDWYFFLAHTMVNTRRLIKAVGDKFLFKIPGFGGMIEALEICTGTVDSCADVLKEGSLLAISPGGVREALFGDENYNLVWGNRIGFAKVAIAGKAPIIPVFTQNIREAYCALGLFRGWTRKIYEKLRLPIVPIYGGFPVKLRTYLGKPIPYDPNMTPEMLAHKTAKAIEELRDQHQYLPGSILKGLVDRVQDKTHQKCL